MTPIFLAAILLAQSLVGSSFTVQERARLLEGISQQLSHYVFPAVAEKVRLVLQKDRGRLVAIGDPNQFAQAVTADMREAGHDRHLGLHYYSEGVPPMRHLTPEQQAHQERSVILDNSYIISIASLLGNVGYIRIDGFANDTPATRKTIDAAMAFVRDSDELIIDLRQNGGGYPASLDYWMGYFFKKKTELTSIRTRAPAAIERQFSATDTAGPHYGNPILVLTSGHSISCAEQFTYDLQALHRATVVGEQTAGGANPGHFIPLDGSFAVFIPTGQAYNPYTKSNWEGSGIRPDIMATAARALIVAYKAALTSDRNSFSDIVEERKMALKDPESALRSVFSL